MRPVREPEEEGAEAVQQDQAYLFRQTFAGRCQVNFEGQPFSLSRETEEPTLAGFMRISLIRSFRVGFTLIELLIVITIIAVLAGIAIPAFNGVTKTRACDTRCIIIFGSLALRCSSTSMTTMAAFLRLQRGRAQLQRRRFIQNTFQLERLSNLPLTGGPFRNRHRTGQLQYQCEHVYSGSRSKW